jgi:polyisoprenoid-binding protein YceI
MTTASELIADTQPGTTWTLARDRSTVTFRNKTLWGAATVKGTFSDLDGSGEITLAHTVTGHLRIGAASLSTGIGKRDDHLRSADFFDVSENPVISVDVHGATVTGPDAVDLDATLTIRKIARRLHLPATVTVVDDGAVRITASTDVDRKEFDVGGNMLGMVGPIARLVAEAVFTPKAGDAP